MTNQAIHRILRLRGRLVHILPSITHMAGRAAGLVGYRHAAKAVDHLAFAKGLPGFFVLVKPGPVGSAPNLLAGFGMAFQAGGGYIFCPFKRALQCLELTVICRSEDLSPAIALSLARAGPAINSHNTASNPDPKRQPNPFVTSFITFTNPSASTVNKCSPQTLMRRAKRIEIEQGQSMRSCINEQ